MENYFYTLGNFLKLQHNLFLLESDSDSRMRSFPILHLRRKRQCPQPHGSAVYARHLLPLTSFSHIFDLCCHVSLTKPLFSLSFFVKLLLLNVVVVLCLFVVRLLEIVGCC
jgi:hypothetical protein